MASFKRRVREASETAAVRRADRDLARFAPELGPVRPAVATGLEGIASLIQRPGALSPNIASAIQPRVAMESEATARNFANLLQEQAGMAARTNLPLSFKNALAAGTGIAGERAQRDIRRGAMAESEGLRRDDLSQVYELLDRLMQARGLGAQEAAGRRGERRQEKASQLATYASLIGAFASGSKFKEGARQVDGEQVLAAVNQMPVYKWRYKGGEGEHVGPMAEDFNAALGVGDAPDDMIQGVDANGALMAAIQALTRRLDALEGRG